MIEYSIYYRKYGVRRLSNMINPVMTPINKFFLPFNSVVHYMPDDKNAVGPTSDDVFLQKNKQFVLIEHVDTLLSTLSNPIGTFIPATRFTTPYHLNFKHSKRIKEIENTAKQDKSILVINYALLPKLYKYISTSRWDFHLNEWTNRQITLWKHVAEVAEKTTRNQFIKMDIPDVLPAVPKLQLAEGKMTQQMYESTFTDPSCLFLLEVWKWLGDNRSASILSNVKAEHFNKVNLVWFVQGRWTVLNLGLMNEWRRNKGENKSDAVDSFTLQKRFLRLLMAIGEVKSINNSAIDEDEMVEEPVVDNDTVDQLAPPVATTDQTIEHIDNVKIETPTYIQHNVAKKNPLQGDVKIKQKLPDINKDDNEPENENDTTIDDNEVDEDLKVLEKLEKKPEAITVEYKAYSPPINDFEHGVLNEADRIAKSGLMSGAEFRRMTRLATKFKELPNPYTGKGKLEDLTVINPSETHIEEHTPIAEKMTGVIDKSMLSSSLEQFDKKYIEKILPKDIVTMVMQIQKAGIAVQDYKVERYEDVNDLYDVHSIKIVPVIGASTTLKIRLPVVNPDGVFVVSGIKCRLRKQRGDQPIRKISPNEVALTSYYSKMFVSRSERAVFNYVDWLNNNIMAIAIDTENSKVTDIKVGNVFDSESNVPRVYSSIAMRMSGFTSGEFTFNFNYNKRIDFFGEAIVKGLENTKSAPIPIAKSKDTLLVMNNDNQILSINIKTPKEGYKTLGTIEEFLGISTDKRPVEMAEVGMFGKTVPVAFILGFHIGLGNLLKTLDVEPRRVPKHTSLNLQPNEFAIKFSDETLVISRDNSRAALILSGFNRYHQDVKRFSVYDFDKKEAYQTVLENNMIGARFTREFDLMFKLWVDHITEELLKELNEPTDLFNLFISAVDKLTQDSHPEPMDNLYMRDKGYERFAGLMYGEIAKALRVYKSRPSTVAASVDLNPFAVWQAIMQDPTKTVIEEKNPIHTLKEQEVVVFRGAGGRTSRSMTDKSRVYHRSGMGVVSEATTDNSDVATITYLTADPNYKSVRGTIRKTASFEGNTAKLISTSMLLAPSSGNDD